MQLDSPISSDEALWREDKASLNKNSSPVAHKDLTLDILFFVTLPYFRCVVIFTDYKTHLWPLLFPYVWGIICKCYIKYLILVLCYEINMLYVMK